MVMVPWGEWLPDLPDFQNPGATEAKNVFPAPNSYIPIKSPQAPSDLSALSERVQGKLFAAKMPSSGGGETAPTTVVYAGTDTTLSVLVADQGDEDNRYPTDWKDRTPTATVNTAAGDDWYFAQFGSQVIAVNGSDAPQAHSMAGSADFADLDGSPPVASFVAIVGDFVVLARLASALATVRWSGINNAESWTVSATTQADLQAMPDGGEVTGLVGGQFGVVFQETAIRRMTYVGSPLVFRFDVISNDYGCLHPASIAEFKENIFFLSQQGFAVVSGGQTVTPIGKGKVDQYFRETLLAETDTVKPKIIGIVDTQNQRYIVAYPSTASTAFVQDRVLVYDIPTGKWSRAEITVESFGMVYKRIEDGSTDYFTNEIVLAAIGTDHKLKFFDGANMAAVLETTEAQIFPGRRAFVQGVYPIVDGGDDADITVQVAARSAPNDTVTFGSAVAMNANGMSPQRSSGRYHRARVNIGAGETWTHAQGVEVEAVPEGKR